MEVQELQTHIDNLQKLAHKLQINFDTLDLPGIGALKHKKNLLQVIDEVNGSSSASSESSEESSNDSAE